jgi:uncharacterized protein
MFNLERFPPFQPPAWLRNGHAQTMAAVFPSAIKRRIIAVPHHIALSDGDALVLHDDLPASWELGDRVLLLIHGLAGSHASACVRRIAHKACNAGFRALRLDLRGCGAGVPHARHAAHSGCWHDVGAAIAAVARLCPNSPIAAVGFSLGGNLLLNWLGEEGSLQHDPIDAALAICPPIDLTIAADNLRRKRRRFYDRLLTRRLLKQIARHMQLRPDCVRFTGDRPPRNMREVDSFYTVAVGGYRDADDYYVSASPLKRLMQITCPTGIVAAADDPLVPAHMFRDLKTSDAVQMAMLRHGGHLGFIGRRGIDPDRYWLDWRVLEWLQDMPKRRFLTTEEAGRPQAMPVNGSARVVVNRGRPTATTAEVAASVDAS